MLPNGKIVYDGEKNSVVEFAGYECVKSGRIVLPFNLFSHNPKSLRLDAVIFSFAEDCHAQLWWATEETELPLVPLSGRGMLDLDKIRPLQSPDGLKYIAIDLWSRQADYDIVSYLIVLNLEKGR